MPFRSPIRVAVLAAALLTICGCHKEGPINWTTRMLPGESLGGVPRQSEPKVETQSSPSDDAESE